MYPNAAGGADIGVLVGPKAIRQRVRLEAFGSVEAARDALTDPAAVHRLREKLRRWWAGGAPRSHLVEFREAKRWGNLRRGPKRRDGDVTAEQFYEIFRPRGISFGASITQAERQRMLNVTFDYAADLADLLDIDPAALFFNRRVALAFGGRLGNVTYLACYNIRDRRICFRRHVGGAAYLLAHEWLHALDWHTPHPHTGKVPQRRYELTLSEAIADHVNDVGAFGEPSYRKRSENQDLRGRKSKGIVWSRREELAARAFEALVRLESRRRNWRSTPVAGLPSWSSYRDSTAAELYHYPTREELVACREALLALVRNAHQQVMGGLLGEYRHRMRVRVPPTFRRAAKM